MTKKKSQTIDSYKENVLRTIQNLFARNSNCLLEVTTIKPLISNTDFLNFAFRKRIEFTSIEDKEIAEMISTILLYLSNQQLQNNQKLSFAYTNSEIYSNEFAIELGPVIERVKKDNNFKRWSNTARKLNEYGLKSIQDGVWNGGKAKSVWERWQKLEKEHTLKIGPLLDQLECMDFKAYSTKAYMLNSKDLLTLQRELWDCQSVEKTQIHWETIKRESNFIKILNPNLE